MLSRALGFPPHPKGHLSTQESPVGELQRSQLPRRARPSEILRANLQVLRRGCVSLCHNVLLPSRQCLAPGAGLASTSLPSCAAGMAGRSSPKERDRRMGPPYCIYLLLSCAVTRWGFGAQQVSIPNVPAWPLHDLLRYHTLHVPAPVAPQGTTPRERRSPLLPVHSGIQWHHTFLH